MSIYGAMFSGVSALAANGQALGMISDNISNLNTIGYKNTEARFSTLVTSSALKTKYAPGGVRSIPFQLVERQGLLQASESATDIAISGRGMIVVAEAPLPASGDRYLFTRAGQFSIDKDGYLVNTGGYYLQGWPTTSLAAYDVDQDSVADTSSPDPTSLTNLKPLQVSTLIGAAQSTATIRLGLNVPATAAVAATEALTVKIFDSLGVEHNVALQWAKTVASPATWTLSVTGITLASSGGASTTLGFPILINTVVFNGNGTPSAFTPVALSIPAANWTTAASASTITFNLGSGSPGQRHDPIRLQLYAQLHRAGRLRLRPLPIDRDRRGRAGYGGVRQRRATAHLPTAHRHLCQPRLSVSGNGQCLGRIAASRQPVPQRSRHRCGGVVFTVQRGIFDRRSWYRVHQHDHHPACVLGELQGDHHRR